LTPFGVRRSAINQDRIRDHKIQQLVGGHSDRQAQLGIGRSLLAQQRPHRDSHSGDQFWSWTRVGGVSVFDDDEFFGRLRIIASVLRDVAAIGVVIDRDRS